MSYDEYDDEIQETRHRTDVADGLVTGDAPLADGN